MKQEFIDRTVNGKTGLTDVEGEVGLAWTSQKAYHELADVPVQEVDLFESLAANRQHLEELEARLRFMIREVKQLMKI